MTQRDFNRMFQFWVKRLGLERFRFEIELDVQFDVDQEARVNTSNHYDKAVIQFAEGWREWDAQTLEEIIVHELVHVVLHPLCLAFESTNTWMSTDMRAMFTDRNHVELERVVERLAWSLVAASHGQSLGGTLRAHESARSIPGAPSTGDRTPRDGTDGSDPGDGS